MAEKRRSFILFADRKKEIDMLTNEQAGAIFKAILAYVDAEEEPSFDDLALSVLFSVFKSQIDENAKKYADKAKRNEEYYRRKKTNSANSENSDKFSTIQNFQSDSASDTDTDTGTDNDTGTLTDTDTDTDSLLRKEDKGGMGGKSAAPPPAPPPKPVHHKHGEFGWVRLTDAEYERLVSNYGKDVTERYIKKLDEYCQMNDNKNKYKDWNMALRNWMNRDNVRKLSEQGKAQDSVYEDILEMI